MNEERKNILELLAQGKITVAEAQELLAALEDSAGESAVATVPAPGRPNPGKTWLHIEVLEAGREKVHLRIPVMLARLGLKFLPREVTAKLNGADLKVDLEEILTSLRRDTLGDIVHVTDENHEVHIYVA